MECKKNQAQFDQQQLLPCHTNNSKESEMIQQRRSSNYTPNIWKYDFLQSLSSKYEEEHYERLVEKLTEEVKKFFFEAVGSLAKLELIDTITKLGIASHFEKEIKEALSTINNNLNWDHQNLYATALRFRVLRQHCYEVSEDVFRGFMNEMGRFMESKSEDVRGLIELFEASHLAIEGENILEEAKSFSTRILRNTYNSGIESNLAKYVVHALELSSHWRVQWFDVKWHINAFEEDKNTEKILLDMAKVNFNMVQAKLQKDLRDISRWWRNLGLMENLNFTRDRLVESFLCSVGVVFEPQNSCFRKWLTKAIIMVLVIDDVYDVYGSLEELQRFTSGVTRWQTREIPQLPECMKLCFQALCGIVNETACEMHNEKVWTNAHPYLKKEWTDFCKSLFLEAVWYNKGYVPTLQEYLNNAWISSSGPVLSVHSVFAIMKEEPDDMANFFKKNQELLYNISLIIRLCNDLGTSEAEQERGDAASSIGCCMQEMNVPEEIARNHIKDMINNAWKKINGHCFTQSPKLQLFVNINTNMARVAHNLYQNGDGFGVQDRENKKQILSLLVEPLRLE